MASSVAYVNVFMKNVMSSKQLLARYPHPANRKRMISKWKATAVRMSKLGRYSFGNKVQVMSCWVDELLKACKQAKKSVVMEMYTISSDSVGQRIMQSLTELRKSTNVNVAVIYDALGSMSTPRSVFAELRQHGGIALAFNPVFGWPILPRLHSMFHRNHRKIVSIDGKIGFIGGMNLSEKYACTAVGGSGYFLDTQVKIEGPAVAHLTHVCHESLSSIDPTFADNNPPPVVDAVDNGEGVCVQVLDSNFNTKRMDIRTSLCEVFATSQSYIHITSPYFFPPYWLKRRILNAAKRGVEVTLITAGDSDVPFVKYASRHIYSQFLRRGVKIYEMYGDVIHEKTITSDGLVSFVGSFNFDLWSAFGNLETNIAILDRNHVREFDKQFSQNLKKCKEVTLEQMNNRSSLEKFFNWALCQMAKILRPPKWNLMKRALERLKQKDVYHL